MFKMSFLAQQVIGNGITFNCSADILKPAIQNVTERVYEGCRYIIMREIDAINFKTQEKMYDTYQK